MKLIHDRQAWPIIDIEVIPASQRIRPGEGIKLSWKVENAEQTYLIELPGRPFEVTGGAVDWSLLAELGELVDFRGGTEKTPTCPTTFTIAAIGKTGRLAKSFTICIDESQTSPEIKAKTWYNVDELPDPGDFVHPFERDRDLWRAVLCAIRGPQVALAIDRCCLYTDEPAHLEWRATCANCEDMWTNNNGMRLQEDLTLRSGTTVRYFFEGGGSTRIDTITCCLLPRTGEADVDHSVAFGTEPGSEWAWTVLAEDHRGRSAVESVRAWFIPRPRLQGCSPGRCAEVEEAVLELCRLLHRGCIAAASTLDSSVAAFRDGRLSRLGILESVKRQLWNLDLITFKCADVRDPDWRGSKWEEFTNIIELQWSPSHRPYLPYLILHELLHKVGFNGDLSAFYSDAQIENQVHQVARACFPQLPFNVPSEG